MLSLPTQTRKMPSSLVAWRRYTCTSRTYMCSLLPPLTMSCDLPQTCLKDRAVCLKSLWHYLCPVFSEKLHTCQSRSGVPHLKCLWLQVFQTLWPSDLGLFPTLYQWSMRSVKCVICKGPKFQALVWHIMIKKFWTIFGVWISESGMSKLCTFSFFKQFLFCSITSIEENNGYFFKIWA